jgi:GNAT superfamily N-acetyltransferase
VSAPAKSAVTVEPLTGAALTEALPALARLRVEVFRAWPYLYEGTLDYEQGYLKRFAAAQDAVVVAARTSGGDIVGVATASPLRGHSDKFAPLFEAHGFEPDRVFYCGESVLQAAYRGLGIGNRFFDLREAHARAATGPDGRYRTIAFCGVVRPADHPARHAGYVPLDAFWRKRGYAPVPGMVGSFDWLDVGDTAQTAHPMQFWVKAL